MEVAPGWFSIDPSARPRLRHLWDDARGSDDIRPRPDVTAAVLRAAIAMAPRARMALAVGLFEWLVWRFDGLHLRPEPGQLVQAGWCATADPRYLRFFELSREAWRGPVAGPLWAAIARLRPALAQGLDFPGELYDALAYLTAAALHVQPEPAPLLAWLRDVTARLPAACPAPPDDPFTDLFGRHPGPRLGPLVARDHLDPRRPVPGEAEARVFLDGVLADARSEANPFLIPPDELADTGFSAVPYAVSR